MWLREGSLKRKTTRKQPSISTQARKKNESVLPSRVAKATQNNLWISVQVIEGKM